MILMFSTNKLFNKINDRQVQGVSPDTTNLKMEAVYSNFSEAKEIKENQKKIAERLEVDKWGIPPNMNIFGNQQISWSAEYYPGGILQKWVKIVVFRFGPR